MGAGGAMVWFSWAAGKFQEELIEESEDFD